MASGYDLSRSYVTSFRQRFYIRRGIVVQRTEDIIPSQFIERHFVGTFDSLVNRVRLQFYRVAELPVFV